MSGEELTTLAIELREDQNGPVLATEPVRPADLREALSELWWHGYARRGEFALDELDMDVSLQPVPHVKPENEPEPEPENGALLCQGYLLKTVGADGKQLAVSYSMLSLYPVAQRGAAELILRGMLADAETFYYDLRAIGPDPEQLHLLKRTCQSHGRVLSRSRDTSYETLPLPALMEHSRAVGPEAPGDHELFYTESALRRAESIARRGEQVEPAVETGGILVGRLGWCPAAGDAFVMVVDALEARHAEQRAFSLSFSGKTWQRLQAVVRARREEAGEGALRILGQTHGHPFSPGEPCAACASTPDCPKHTAFLSPEDRLWSRAVFSGQPWQVGHMFGINARGEPTARVFGLSAGRLEPRGYRVIADEDLQRIRQHAMTGTTKGTKGTKGDA